MKSKDIIKNVFLFIFKAMRLSLFLVMYWLRAPILMVGGYVSCFSLMALIISYIVHPVSSMLWGFGLVSFFSFSLLWLYDYILIELSPNEMARIL
ncbi:hypothetical protein [Janthinobacterium sp. FW305-128]|uniref:hypothetical protein n=1 Tax=Janthinobacterium sp. FW305-128 TaxID=2775055 RepID=UPI001E36F71A|nr:hypothetical protein [Janthinobacterium sp. FW305-128]MCC7684740.1 hypothetical protein [Janthinobacterium sp. FW305-128]